MTVFYLASKVRIWSGNADLAVQPAVQPGTAPGALRVVQILSIRTLFETLPHFSALADYLDSELNCTLAAGAKSK